MPFSHRTDGEQIKLIKSLVKKKAKYIHIPRKRPLLNCMFSLSASSVASITANYVAQDDETRQGWDVTLALCCPPCFSEVLQNPACILQIEHFHLNDALKQKKNKTKKQRRMMRAGSYFRLHTGIYFSLHKPVLSLIQHTDLNIPPWFLSTTT